MTSPGVEEAGWRIDGCTLSGLVASPPQPPRATVLLLHGGGGSAAYWNGPLDASSSFLRLGARLGYQMIAIDRPGYGASYGLVGDAVRADRQVATISHLADAIRREKEVGAGYFLVGFSQGAVITAHLAAAGLPNGLLGIEIAGLPYHFKEGLVDRDQLMALGHLPDQTWPQRRALAFGPDGTFDPAVERLEGGLRQPVPAAEIIDAADSPTSLPRLAARITVPVEYTVAEFEASSDGGLDVLEDVRPLFTATPRLSLHPQVGAGHCLSLHYVARAYHLRVLAFFDEVMAMRNSAGGSWR